MMRSGLRHSLMMGIFSAGMLTAGDLPIGVEELLREPVKAESRTTSRVKCNHDGLKAIAPKVTAQSRTKRTTVAKADKGFKLFKWLL